MNVNNLKFVVVLFVGILNLPATGLAADGGTGRELYLKYCSSCHGGDGKGKGPLSGDLKVKVPDLTTLAKSNKGIYPSRRVMSAIDGSRKIRGHGEPTMPVWGEVFKEELKAEKYQELTTLRKTQAITDYISSIQR
jgi:mono/diheme cytochrome c family protein